MLLGVNDGPYFHIFVAFISFGPTAIESVRDGKGRRAELREGGEEGGGERERYGVTIIIGSRWPRIIVGRYYVESII